MHIFHPVFIIIDEIIIKKPLLTCISISNFVDKINTQETIFIAFVKRCLFTATSRCVECKDISSSFCQACQISLPHLISTYMTLIYTMTS